MGGYTWRNTKNEVCSLCSNLEDDGTPFEQDSILTLPNYLKYAVEATSFAWLIKVNESLYCENCWNEHIRTDELFTYELPKSYMYSRININKTRAKGGWDPWPIHERIYNYWIKQGWMSTNRQVIS